MDGDAMYAPTRRGFLKYVSVGIGLMASSSAFADEFEVPEGYVDLPLSARTVGNLILKTSGPISFTWRSQDGSTVGEASNISLESSINAGLDQTADVRVAFAYRAALSAIGAGSGIDYAFLHDGKSLLRGALYTKERVGADRWPRHVCQERYDVMAPRLLVPRASFLLADTFRFILNAGRFSTC